MGLESQMCTVPLHIQHQDTVTNPPRKKRLIKKKKKFNLFVVQHFFVYVDHKHTTKHFGK